MKKADKYYIQNIQKIMSEGSWDENPRPKYSDGTPAHSRFITQVFEEYDISKGEFPIVRKTYWWVLIKLPVSSMLIPWDIT